jgi:hypothetical protein
VKNYILTGVTLALVFLVGRLLVELPRGIEKFQREGWGGTNVWDAIIPIGIWIGLFAFFALFGAVVWYFIGKAHLRREAQEKSQTEQKLLQ